MSFEHYIKLLECDFHHHPHWGIACRVLMCLDYIEQHLDEISTHAGKKEALRDSFSQLTFQLHGMDTPDEVKTNFSRLIADTRNCLEQLLQIPDAATKKAKIDGFLLNIDDSPDGSMETRLRTALNLAMPSDRKWQRFFFKDKKEAESYLAFVKSILPAFASELAKASIKLDQQNGYTFCLSAKQYQALRQALHQASQPQLSQAHSAATHATFLDTLKNKDGLIKTVRWDKNCFLYEFLEGVITHPKKPKEKFPLRPTPHKKWTVDGTGVYQRKINRPSPYGLAPEQLAAEKAARSQPQSVSLITPQIQAPVFGHNRDRGDKLVAFFFLAIDALFNRFFLYDGGTFKRPYEFNNEEDARRYFDEKVKSANPVLFSSFEEFKKAIKEDKYSEILARIRFLIDSCGILICRDNFESRCIAQYYAEQTKQELKKLFSFLNIAWDDTYQVPIAYYLPKNSKHKTLYTSEAQIKDRQEAQAIFQDPVRRKAALDAENPEFLLLLDNPYTALGYIDLLQTKNLPHVVLAIFARCINAAPVDINQLTTAAQQLTPDTIKHFLKKNKKLFVWLVNNKLINPNMKLESGNTFLHWAAEKGHIDCVKALLACPGIDLNVKNNIGDTALIVAAQEGHLECVKALLTCPGIDPNAKSNNGNTALIWSAYKGHIECIKALLACPGIDLHTKNNIGNTALIVAVKNENVGCVDALLERHDIIDPNEKNNEGDTALMCAIKENQKLGCIKALFTHPNLDINAKSSNGSTALISIVKRNRHIEFMDILLASPGIDYNAKDNDNRTALIWAATAGRLNHVKALLDCPNIDLYAKGKNGCTALSTAALLGHKKIAIALAIPMIKHYLLELEERPTERDPRVPLPSFFLDIAPKSLTTKLQGFTKTEKKMAAERFLRVLRRKENKLTQDDIDALKDGHLWHDIIRHLPKKLLVCGKSTNDKPAADSSKAMLI